MTAHGRLTARGIPNVWSNPSVPHGVDLRNCWSTNSRCPSGASSSRYRYIRTTSRALSAVYPQNPGFSAGGGAVSSNPTFRTIRSMTRPCPPRRQNSVAAPSSLDRSIGTSNRRSAADTSCRSM
ncbi:hypothetical protein ACFQY7_16080 [Actinomadura luteofluorescens]|uniref:hypothetical protein n=1 Tax=Actinomadura luteofluorescens TaxID=46163 RepID=UPI00363EE6B3